MQAAVFDIGGVLIEWNAPRLFRGVLGDDDSVERFMREVDFYAWNDGLDRGEPFAPSVAALRAKHDTWAHVIDAFSERWAETIGPVIAAGVAVVDELRGAGVACFGLSNWSPETIGRSPIVSDVLARLDGVLLSGEVGVCKPDPAIYQEAERRFGLVPETTWFTDDNPANVAAAVARGWKGHVCTDPSELRAAVVAAGLLGSQP